MLRKYVLRTTLALGALGVVGCNWTPLGCPEGYRYDHGLRYCVWTGEGDAGPPRMPRDSGPRETDAGDETDAGEAVDAGDETDAGEAVDAGDETDAGAGDIDAG